MRYEQRRDPDPEEFEPDSEVGELGPEMPEADAIEQRQPSDPDEVDDEVEVIPAETSEADALDQLHVAPLGEEP